jgi:hypothetical protein
MNSFSKTAKRFNLAAWVCVGLSLVASIPSCLNARRRAHLNYCLDYQQQICFGKRQWALDHHKAQTGIPTPAEVAVYLKDFKFPTCPDGGVYTVGCVSENPACTILGHKLPR